VTDYDAGWKGTSIGGGAIRASDTHGSNVPAGKQLQWVQVISKNVPLGGATSPYLDPQPNDDTLPFYWTTAELPTYTSGRNLQFSDFSTRSVTTLASTDPITWNANLYLLDWDGGTTVNVYDGVNWGWTTTSARLAPVVRSF
jgi:hypothetical protein